MLMVMVAAMMTFAKMVARKMIMNTSVIMIMNALVKMRMLVGATTTSITTIRA